MIYKNIFKETRKKKKKKLKNERKKLNTCFFLTQSFHYIEECSHAEAAQKQFSLKPLFLNTDDPKERFG